MSFTDFVTHAWDEHATQPATVAERLATEGVALVTEPAHVAPLAQLVHHVLGEHLGRWDDGLAALHALAAHPTSTVSACFPLCAAAPTTARRWSNCAATSPARRLPTSAYKPTPPGRWYSNSRPLGATAPPTW